MSVVSIFSDKTVGFKKMIVARKSNKSIESFFNYQYDRQTMKSTSALLFVITIFSFFITASTAPRIVEGPKDLPHVTSEMETADFWINRCSRPDELLLTEQQCETLNQKWEKQGLVFSIFDLPVTIKKHPLRQWIKEDFSYLERVGRYNEKGELLTRESFKKLIANTNLEALKGSNSVKFGLTVCQTNLKLFPTADIITAKPLDVEFSIIPHSMLMLAEPVAVLFESKDNNWFFVHSEVGRGWVQKDHIALGKSKDEVRHYSKEANAIVTSGRALFIYNGISKSLQAFMGAKIVLENHEKGEFKLPFRKKDGFLGYKIAKIDKKSSFLLKPLAVSQRDLLEQAFKLLHEPYGWGGERGFGDCSEFIRRIGLSCGLRLPRSTNGLKKGLLKSNIIRKEKGSFFAGQTLLTLPGHVMMVVGERKGSIYVIHNLYGIHGADKKGNYIKRVARVLVSDLSLGKGSQKGSLRQRLDYKLEIK